MIKHPRFLILFLILPILLLAEPGKKLFKPVDPPINTKYSDFAPSFTSDGRTMFFNSRRGGSHQDLYSSRLKDGKWSEPLNLRALNSRHHDETPFVTPDGKFLFFASDRNGSLKMPRDFRGQVPNSYDIYRSKNVNGNWTPPERIQGNVNTINNERAPSFCLQTETLYYTSWHFNDEKKSRIMKAKLINGEFNNVQELPPPVNTNNQDMAIVPNPDCSGFYFSSRRPGGFGGWDIFFVPFKNGVFEKPVNMGAEINTSDNEFFYSRVMSTIYLCSNRSGTTGRYDIFLLKLEKKVRFIVLNKKTGKPLLVTAKLLFMEKAPSSGRPGRSTIEKKSDAKGKFIVNIDPFWDKLDIIINEKGFLPFIKAVEPDKIGDDLQILTLIPIEKDASFDLHAIHFDFNSAKLRPESYRHLNLLAEYMKQNKRLRFRIIGHTDLHGDFKYNKKFSLKRAKSVREYLVKKGIDSDRFEVEGAGKSRPKVAKKGAGFDEKNRRTEFKLIGKD